ncbi:MAG: 4a-hydroxytetrahydrobiopterin dehydratase [Actinomycetales bacterium]|jgi:4a-hydroxytetrahydrobiopterin dehydratase|nr:4a-hydroxytetrahydrobiopterin dehydratase [Candidatus Phosphoribacter baldrii]MBK6954278.1 4a-hydroxytetrahydrobiopterin dehydratase [Candidatus Phosphoribacter baldrii]
MDTTSGRLSRADASGSLPNWRYLLGRMHLTVATGDFAAALAFVDRVGALAEEQGHHPEIDLRWGRVHVATGSHDVGGVSERDVRLGLAIDTVVTELGLTSQPHRLGEVEIAVDAMDIGAVRPFWAAVLGWPTGDPGADGAEGAEGNELVDPDRVGPTLWFQQMDAPRPQRNRIHVDVTVAHDEADRRVAAALAAGGRLVSDAEAPSFWVLADVEGNEVCVCTWQNRDQPVHD